MANKRDLKKHAEEFGEQGGASKKTQLAIRAAFKNQPKKAKKAKKETPKKKAWYEGIGKGRYAKKAISAFKKERTKNKQKKAAQKKKSDLLKVTEKTAKKHGYGPIEGLKQKREIGPKEYKGPDYKRSDKSPFKSKPKKMTQIPKTAKVGDKRTREKSKLSNFGASFKKNCAGKDASHTFTWKDKKYTCAKK